MGGWSRWAAKLDASLGRREATGAAPPPGESSLEPQEGAAVVRQGEEALRLEGGSVRIEAAPPATEAASVSVPFDCPAGVRVEAVAVGPGLAACPPGSVLLAQPVDRTSLKGEPVLLAAGCFTPPAPLRTGDVLSITATITFGMDAEWTPEGLAREGFGRPVSLEDIPPPVQTPEGLKVPVFVHGPSGRRLVGAALIRGAEKAAVHVGPAYVPLPGPPAPAQDAAEYFRHRLIQDIVDPLAHRAFGSEPPRVVLEPPAWARVEPAGLPGLQGGWVPEWLGRLRRHTKLLAEGGRLAYRGKASAPWTARAAACPVADLARAWGWLDWKGEPGAVAWMNRATFNEMRLNANPGDLGGRWGPSGCPRLPLAGVNSVLAAAGLPPVGVEDGIAEEDRRLWLNLPDGAALLVMPGAGDHGILQAWPAAR